MPAQWQSHIPLLLRVFCPCRSLWQNIFLLKCIKEANIDYETGSVTQFWGTGLMLCLQKGRCCKLAWCMWTLSWQNLCADSITEMRVVTVAHIRDWDWGSCGRAVSQVPAWCAVVGKQMALCRGRRAQSSTSEQVCGSCLAAQLFLHAWATGLATLVLLPPQNHGFHCFLINVS